MLYAPIFVLVIFSFNENRSVTIWTEFSLSWYRQAWENEGIQEAAWLSIQVAVVATLTFFAIIKEATGVTGIGYLMLAHTVFCIPFAYLPIRARLEDMNLVLEQAAADLYATPWQGFRRVTLPLMAPGILAGAMLAFVISLDDVVISLLVAGPGSCAAACPLK